MRHDSTDMGSNSALVLAGCLYVAICLYACNAAVPGCGAGQYGICLPLPQQWNLIPAVSLALNILLTLLCALLLVGINRIINFIPSTSVVYASVLLLGAGAIPMLDTGLNLSTLLLAANVLALRITFSQYGRHKINPAAMCLLGSIFSVGSMMHYSFIAFAVAYALAAVVLKTFHLRQLLGLLMGIIAPYWILPGLGIVPLSAMHLPTIAGVWQAPVPGYTLFWPIMTTCVTAFSGLMLSLRNSVALFSASTATRAFSYALALPGMACLVLLFADWENFMVYYLSISMFAAIQGGYMVALGKRIYGAVIYWTATVVYLFLTVISLYTVLT